MISEASLLSADSHNPALLELIALEPSEALYNYVAEQVTLTVQFALSKPTASSSKSPDVSPAFSKFVSDVLSRSEVNTPTILASLAYLSRARPHLHIALETYALERVFLGTIILAAKYVNDSTLKNVHWAMCTGVFGRRDIGRIEREMLDVLDWELGLQQADVDAVVKVVCPIVAPHLSSSLSPLSPTLSSSSSSTDVEMDHSSFSSDEEDMAESDSDSEDEVLHTPRSSANTLVEVSSSLHPSSHPAKVPILPVSVSKPHLSHKFTLPHQLDFLRPKSMRLQTA